MGGSKSKQPPPSYKRGKLYDDTPTARRKIAEMQDKAYQRGDLARLIKKAVKGKAPKGPSLNKSSGRNAPAPAI